jgi:purine nucleoside phosphorylase
VIGGSGLYEMPGLLRVRELAIETPYGSPSDALVEGYLEGNHDNHHRAVRSVFLPLLPLLPLLPRLRGTTPSKSNRSI